MNQNYDNPLINSNMRPDTLEAGHKEMLSVLQLQRDEFTRDLPVSFKKRADRIDRAIGLLVDHTHEITEAVAADFGSRNKDFTAFADIAHSIIQLKAAKKKLRSWMRPEKRRPDFFAGMLGAKARIHHMPKGVVGIISPWNFPVSLCFGPLSGALAAGNRVMLKPSEHSPATSALIAALVPKYFANAEIAVFTGGLEVAKSFSLLPFDHLFFTGGTQAGRSVMRSAAENLVPVTLELGGKSPVIIGLSADLAEAAERVVIGKLLNAGQVCLAPDYVLVPEKHLNEFCDRIAAAAKALYPKWLENPDHCSIINDHHYRRLKELIDDAAVKGFETKVVNPVDEESPASSLRKLPLHLVINPGEEARVMQAEIFGPILPIQGYKEIDEAIRYVNNRPRPLSLYYFGTDHSERDKVLSRTISGGATVNDVILHVFNESLPFGGIGASGLGSYHGRYGFATFSHFKAVYYAPKINFWNLMGMRPPYGKKLQFILKLFIRR